MNERPETLSKRNMKVGMRLTHTEAKQSGTVTAILSKGFDITLDVRPSRGPAFVPWTRLEMWRVT